MKFRFFILLLFPILALGQGKRTYSQEEMKQADWFISESNDTIIYHLLIDKTEIIQEDTFNLFELITVNSDSSMAGWWKNIWIVKNGQEKLHGEQKYYNDNSYLEQSTFYQNGERLEMWKSFEYYDTKEVFRIGTNYKDSSEYITYHPNGKIWIKSVYKNKKMWNVTEYFDNKGNKLPKGTLKDGTGTFQCYDKNGNEKGFITFKKGKLIKKKSICDCENY